MKILQIIPILLILASCKCKKDIATETTNNNFTETIMVDKTAIPAYPTDGKCKVEIFKNKSLEIKASELGAIYFEKLESPDTSVIMFTYNRNVPANVQDANYREEIIFEINNAGSTVNLKNEDLQKTKMIFGRWCYCKGSAGNYKVVDGILNLTQTSTNIKFDLLFKNNKVPQIIQGISETIKL